MIESAADIVITGLILGGVYALIAVGLSLQYGVGRVLNVSHGEFIILGALATYSLFTVSGVNPLASIAIVTPGMFAVGYVLDRTMFNELRRTSPDDDAFEGRSLLASFGLLFVVQNLMLIFWGANLRGYSYLTGSVSILGNRYGTNRVLALIVAVGVSLVFYVFIRATRTGKAIRAAAESADMASVLGVNKRMVLAVCFGLGTALAGLAGVLYSLMFEIQASRGIELTIVAIVVVVFGGLGSISGSLLGGFLLGLVTSIVNFFDPSLSLVAFYLIFVLVLLVRPSGILGRALHAD
ncbi:MAG: branched-chain amino acid ABC transporter permease [Actinobacteria bacterium]|nr:MAG: branched-chain amino acid ABC transporter permease [Actinomycetota bacterium]